MLANKQTDDGKMQKPRNPQDPEREAGDVVSLHSAGEVMYGTRIHVLPFKDSVDGITCLLFDTYL